MDPVNILKDDNITDFINACKPYKETQDLFICTCQQQPQHFVNLSLPLFLECVLFSLDLKMLMNGLEKITNVRIQFGKLTKSLT